VVHTRPTATATSTTATKSSETTKATEPTEPEIKSVKRVVVLLALLLMLLLLLLTVRGARHVKLPPALRVTQQLVRVHDSAERGAGRVGIAFLVRMGQSCCFSVRTFDVGLRRRLGQTQDLVRVGLFQPTVSTPKSGEEENEERPSTGSHRAISCVQI